MNKCKTQIWNIRFTKSCLCRTIYGFLSFLYRWIIYAKFVQIKAH